MSEKKEFRVGEIFRHNGETFQCVANTAETPCYECALLGSESCLNCMSKYRSDKTDVHFIRVTDPEEGMLFRASDGKLYELKKLENFECGCYIIGYTNCTVISYEAFGEDISDIFHWYPVEEKGEEMIDYSKIELQKVYMKRHLELAVVAIKNDIVTFKVADQFYDENEFCEQHNKSEFKAKNGVAICLSEKLKWDRNNKILSLRRLHDIVKVEETIKCYVHHFAYIMEAVNEYNETDGKGYEKKFPEEGDNFYFITSKMTVSLGEFGSSMDGYEFKMRDAGNCFLTREEAEAALERVKKALRGE